MSISRNTHCLRVLTGWKQAWLMCGAGRCISMVEIVGWPDYFYQQVKHARLCEVLHLEEPDQIGVPCIFGVMLITRIYSRQWRLNALLGVRKRRGFLLKKLQGQNYILSTTTCMTWSGMNLGREILIKNEICWEESNIRGSKSYP